MMQHRAASADPPVYARLKLSLINYAFFPGDHLHVPELADELRVSATPVREALHRLWAEGLLTAVPHRGFFVKKPDQGEISDLLEMKYVLLSHAVNGSVANLVLDRVETVMLSSLAALDQERRASEPSLDLYERYATPLVMLLGSLSKNAALCSCLSNVLDRLHFVRQTEARMLDRSPTLFQECAAIARGLLERREDLVRSLIEQQYKREQAALPDLMKESVNRLYLRSHSDRRRPLRRTQFAAPSA